MWIYVESPDGVKIREYVNDRNIKTVYRIYYEFNIEILVTK